MFGNVVVVVGTVIVGTVVGTVVVGTVVVGRVDVGTVVVGGDPGGTVTLRRALVVPLTPVAITAK